MSYIVFWFNSFDSCFSKDFFSHTIEYIDFGDGSETPTTNSACNIALEQQIADKVQYRQGLTVTGPFYPETDPINVDGTYKRSVYAQIKTVLRFGYCLIPNP